MASLRWYGQRLRSMSGSEVAHRVGRAASGLGERIRVSIGKDWPSDDALRDGLRLSSSDTWNDWAERASHRLSALRPLPSRRASFAATWPQEVIALRRKADAAANGQVELFGQTVSLGSSPMWHRDPKTGREWPPNVFHGAIDIRGGGAKGIWEAARHQHLIAAAQSAWLDGHPAAIEMIERSLSTWFEQNRWRRGVHWCSGLEMAIRLASWTWIAALVGDRLSVNLWRDWTRSVVQYGAHLERHLSLHSSANNHLIGEAAGLVLAGHFVPEWAGAHRWSSLGRAILAREVERQILEDGTPAEQAFHYLGFILDFYFLVLRVAPDFIDEGRVRERLSSAASFISTIGNSALELPVVGDDDGGGAWVMSSAHTSWHSRLALCAAWTGRGEFKQRAGDLEPAAWWLMSDDRLRAWHDLPTMATEPGSAWFRTGGYAALRSRSAEEHLAVFDCGPLGYLSIAAHGHADCLAVCLSLNGRWVLVDPGTFVYHEQPEWRAHFRSTRAHNTLTLGGADQSLQTGHTMWGQRAKANWVSYEDQPGFRWAEGAHDGYTRLSPPCHHQRVVGLSDGNYLVIIDWLTANVDRCVWHFQCAPGLVAKSQGRGALASRDGLRLSWQVLNEAAQVRAIEGREQPIAGWVSPSFGTRLAAPVIEVESAGRANTPYVTVIGWGTDAPHTSLDRTGSEWVLDISHAYGRDTLTLRPPATAHTSTVQSVVCHG